MTAEETRKLSNTENKRLVIEQINKQARAGKTFVVWEGDLLEDASKYLKENGFKVENALFSGLKRFIIRW